jgi:hypothetical protein
MLGAPSAGQFRVHPTGVEIPTGTPLYAVDTAGLYHVFVPVSSDVRIRSDKRSAGVHLDRRVLEENGNQHIFVDISCRKGHLQGVFVHLAEDVLRELSQTPSEPEAACRRVLSRWRELLDHESDRLLSREALVGLYGELWLLRRLARETPSAHSYWVGPLGEIHDFRSDSATLEVKSSLARDGRRFEIHGIGQLAPAGDRPLYLATLLLEQDGPGGETVPDVVADITDLGCDAVSLLTKLKKVGYDPRDAAKYNEFRYSLREMRVFVVDGQFPRIVTETFVGGIIPNQIERLRYTINLGAEPPVPLDEQALEAVFSQLAEGAAS